MATPGVARVVQLNVGSLLEPHWDRRRHEVLAWFERLDPDFVCFQEVWEDGTNPNTAGWLVDTAPSGRWHWCFGGFPFPEDAWPDQSLRFGSAILSRWPIEQHELLALPVEESPRDPHPAWRMRAELLHARSSGVDLFSTHLAPPPGQAYQRIRQVLVIDDAIQDLHDTAAPMPAILCGDFNADPVSDEMRYLTSNAVIDGRSTYYQDAWAVTRPTEPGFTYDHRTNRAAAVLNIPAKRIDYVFVGDPFLRPDSAGSIVAADLAFHVPLTGILASDHFGLVVDVRWPQRPAPDG